MNNRIEPKISEELREIAPDFVNYAENILFGEIWNNPTLTPRERSLITISALISMGETEQLPYHIQLAKKNGINQMELSAIITHIAFYAGWPKATSSLNILMKIK
ncbi:carboxymuconolactone decarboxylase family protein [Neobacillus muris]|uniref:carboxymuconolactone decarboxylase family protein n=1 Tax=Neobacillus muris TaxID=2941334 RepID=UPI00203B1970|nr:carboxymuconolactone decarboxylase family protein [Neobacillus muris]